MELEEAITMDGKLNFNAPLLSIKHPRGFISDEMSTVVPCSDDIESDRIPFCWEQVPGRPKIVDSTDRNTLLDESDTPRPKLPPGRIWHSPPKPPPRPHHQVRLHDHDDGCDADVEDDEDEDDDQAAFSDAMEVLSLTEAIDIVEKAEKARVWNPGSREGSDELDGLTLESFEHSGRLSPTYIIERFLPDAAALATSSALSSVTSNWNSRLPYVCRYGSESNGGDGHSYSSSFKGCGLQMLLPWRMKHKICGVKFPVRKHSPILQPSKKKNKY